MEQNLFNDLLQSAQEMADIEQGKRQAAISRSHTLPDTKKIRAVLGMKQDEFAHAIGVSPSLVQSWEQQRRTPEGAPLKILRLLEKRPQWIKELQTV